MVNYSDFRGFIIPFLFVGIILGSIFTAQIIYPNPSWWFLAWNLFLAFIPLWLTFFLKNLKPGVRFWFLILVWLFFFPNAPYIITDFIHLGTGAKIKFWYQVLLLFSMASLGWLLGILSLRNIRKYLALNYGSSFSNKATLLFLTLSGYGIYLGRIERLNTWDLVTNPMKVFKVVLSNVAGEQNLKIFGFSLLFALFFIITFFFFEWLIQRLKSNEINSFF